jgi:CO/xanthine dehydrogenase Mo-binding subunit
MKEIKLVQPSTFNAGYDSGAYGSRVTFLGGNAVRHAAVDVKRKLLGYAGAKWDTEPHLLDIIDHKIINCDVELGKGDLEMSWKEAVTGYMSTHGGDELVGIGSYYHRTNPKQFEGTPSNYAPSYVFSTGACHLYVDMETGCLDIDEFFFAHDCGQALNPRAVEGQLEGSIYSGLGYTIYEELKLKNGKMLNPNFRDYRMMTALDMPPIVTKYDYPPDSEGPFGAKECGEGTTAPIAPAIANAIHMATGLYVSELPLDPENVWRMLKDQGKIKTGKDAL